MQRIGDHRRIEAFLTSSTLSILFSLVNFFVFGFVLFLYHITIFSIFLICSIAYILWIVLFLKKRKEVDYQRFQEMANNQSSLIEMIQGMQEIKLQTGLVRLSTLFRHYQNLSILKHLINANKNLNPTFRRHPPQRPKRDRPNTREILLAGYCIGE